MTEPREFCIHCPYHRTCTIHDKTNYGQVVVIAEGPTIGHKFEPRTEEDKK